MDKFNAFDLVYDGYVGTADCAKLIRHALKAKFPFVKFSVRTSSYSMGSHVIVNWTDGPTVKTVDDLIACYSGDRFDGSIDMTYSNRSYMLPDGTVTGIRSSGTQGSMGSVSPQNDPQPIGGRLVWFCGSNPSTNRHLSDSAKATINKRIAAKYGHTFEPNTWYEEFGGVWGDQIIWRESYETTLP